MLVVKLGGPTMFARIGIMRALNRHVERAFDPSRKDKHWGRRKMARDRSRMPAIIAASIPTGFALTSCGMLRVAVRVKRARVAGCPRRLARCVAIVVRRTASRGGTLRCAEAHAFPTMVSISPTRLIDYANMAGRDATSRQLCCHSRHLFRSRRKGRDCCNGM